MAKKRSNKKTSVDARGGSNATPSGESGTTPTSPTTEESSIAELQSAAERKSVIGEDSSTLSPRDRLLATASELFYREGIHTVGLERILAEAHVTRATMYRHFAGKEALVAEYLREEDRSLKTLFAAAAEGATSKRHLVDLVIAGIADDIERHHTRGCPFINAAAEYPDEHSEARSIVREHRTWFRHALTDILKDAGTAHSKEAASSLVLLRDAALVGGYLDGVKKTKANFTRTANLVVGDVLAPA